MKNCFKLSILQIEKIWPLEPRVRNSKATVVFGLSTINFKNVDFRMYALTWMDLNLIIIGVDNDNGFYDSSNSVIVKFHWQTKVLSS